MGELVKSGVTMITGALTPFLTTKNLLGHLPAVGTLTKFIIKSVVGIFVPSAVIMKLGAIVKSASMTLTTGIVKLGELSKVANSLLTGTITKFILKVTFGFMTPSGLLMKMGQLFKTGVLLCITSVIKFPMKIATGALIPASTFVKMGELVKSGSITVRGRLTPFSTTKNLSGQSLGSGSLIKFITKSTFLGSITPLVLITKMGELVKSGSMTVSTTFTRMVFLMKTGLLSVIGNIVTQTGSGVQYTLALAAALLPTGAVNKMTSRMWTAFSSLMGTVTRQVTVQQQSTMLLSGMRFHEIGLMKLGTMTPSGTFTKNSKKYVNGALLPVHIILKTTFKSVTRMSIFTSSLVRLTSKTLTGLWTYFVWLIYAPFSSAAYPVGLVTVAKFSNNTSAVVLATVPDPAATTLLTETLTKSVSKTLSGDIIVQRTIMKFATVVSSGVLFVERLLLMTRTSQKWYSYLFLRCLYRMSS